MKPAAKARPKRRRGAVGPLRPRCEGDGNGIGHYVYPHMCRAEHQQIGHGDSEFERCPLCRALDRIDALTRDAKARDGVVRAAVRWAKVHNSRPYGSVPTWWIMAREKSDHSLVGAVARLRRAGGSRK